MPDVFFWLSFADGDRPKGSQFLGVALVSAPGFIEAVRLTHHLGINPGGEVQIMPIPPHHAVPVEYQNRLLTREECAAVDELFAAQTAKPEQESSDA